MRRRSFIGWTGTLACGMSSAKESNLLVRMAYFDKYAPLSQRNTDGSVSGALIDCIDLVGRACGVGFEHSAYPWVRAQLMVERGDLDGFCTVPTLARRAYADFCKSPVVQAEFGIFHRIDDPRPLAVRSLEDLRGLRQGTYRGNGYAREYLEYDRMDIENDEESVLRRIALGTLDAAVEGNLVTPLKIKKLGLSDRIRYTPLTFLPKADFCIGVRKSLPNVAQVVANLERAIQTTKQSGALQSALAKHL